MYLNLREGMWHGKDIWVGMQGEENARVVRSLCPVPGGSQRAAPGSLPGAFRGSLRGTFLTNQLNFYRKKFKINLQMSDLSSECECSLYSVVFVLKEKEYVLNKESPCSMQDSSINKNCHEQTELKHKFQEKRGKIFLKGQNLHEKACSPLEKKLETLCPFAGTGLLDRGTGLCLAQDSVLRDVSFRGRRLLLMKRTASCLLPGPLGSGRAGTGQKVCRRHKKSSVQPCSGPKAALRGRVLFGGLFLLFCRQASKLPPRFPGSAHAGSGLVLPCLVLSWKRSREIRMDRAVCRGRGLVRVPVPQPLYLTYQ